MTRLRVAIFTESLMMRRADGGVYALRDQFPRFAAAIADAATHVTLVSRTSDEAPEQASETPDLSPLAKPVARSCAVLRGGARPCGCRVT